MNKAAITEAHEFGKKVLKSYQDAEEEIKRLQENTSRYLLPYLSHDPTPYLSQYLPFYHSHAVFQRDAKNDLEGAIGTLCSALKTFPNENPPTETNRIKERLKLWEKELSALHSSNLS